jgi:hypothetical protein
MTTFITGIVGSAILLLGAAWPESKNNFCPVKSVRSWLLAIGALVMFAYAILGFIFEDSPMFFVILELFVVIASVMMMLDLPDEIDIPIISTWATLLVVWSLFLFEDYTTIIFIFGLCGIAFGYTFDIHSRKRNAALLIGSLLIALFSYLGASWIFFWLNLFFAIFSAYYLFRSYGNKVN